jgi:uncharacterized protein (TIGR01777 family)
MLRVLISGASGLIGSAMTSALESIDCEITRLVRRSPGHSHELNWNPMRPIPPEIVSGFDAVIHLSGETVAGRWTDAKKGRIRDSRVVSTDNLSQTLAKAEKPPTTFICASAVGYYGNRGEEILTEESLPGDGFLSEVCREWEFATEPAADAGIRTLNLRTGLVLSRNGGALKQMLPLFRLGLGGQVGDGYQWWSWIHIDDLVSAVDHILHPDLIKNVVESRLSSPGHLRGPVNIVAPNPVTNAEFTKALADTLKRPAKFAIPAFVAKLTLGEFAEETLLASTRAVPQKLSDNGFEFRFPDLRSAFRDLLQ